MARSGVLGSSKYSGARSCSVSAEASQEPPLGQHSHGDEAPVVLQVSVVFLISHLVCWLKTPHLRSSSWQRSHGMWCCTSGMTLLSQQVMMLPIPLSGGCTDPFSAELWCQNSSLFLPSSWLTSLLGFSKNLPLMKDFRKNPLCHPGKVHYPISLFHVPVGSYRFVKEIFSISKTQLVHSYADIHSCFSLYFLLIPVNRTLRVI